MSIDDISQSVWDDAVGYKVGEDSDRVTYHKVDMFGVI